jgi:hypothetical protein
VAIEGVSATVPSSFVPMAPERVAKLREAARAADPNTEVSLVGRRPPERPLPWMYLQHAQMRPHLAQAMSVKAVLEGTLEELKNALADSGLSLVKSTSSVVKDSLETCYSTQAPARDQASPVVLNHTCVTVWMGKTSGRVHALSVVCLSTEADAEECLRIIASRKTTASEALVLTETVKP